MERLLEQLKQCGTAAAACQVVVDDLAGAEGLLPSVYLERGGRLRIQAIHGYWQAVDGLPPFSGVIGTTYAVGAPHLEQDVSRAPRYLSAAGGVVAEACHPVRVAGRVVGVVNVEARRPLTPPEVARIAAAAAALGDRLAGFDAHAPESPAQRLVRHAVVMAGLRGVSEIEHATVDAALDVASPRSAALLRLGPTGRPELVVARGPLAGVLEAVPPGVLRAAARYAAAGSSVVTTGRDGTAGPGFAELRALRMERLAVVGIDGGDEDPGRVLLLADGQGAASPPGEVELLELLAAHAAAALRTAADVSALEEQAARDPLTGLGHHATFHRSLREALAAGGRPLALVLIDVDGFKRFNDRHGHPSGDRVLRNVARCLSTGLRRDDRLFRIGGDEFAALVRVDEGDRGEEVGRRLLSRVAFGGAGVSVSVGVAVARPGEAGADLLERADRALYDAKDAGRDRVALAAVVG